MNIVANAKNIILTPKTEWDLIAQEEPNANEVFFSYTLPLILFSAVAVFIGHTFIWHGDGTELPSIGRPRMGPYLPNESITETIALGWGMYYGFLTIIVGAFGIWLTAIVVNAMAKNFGSEKNMGRSMQLVSYAMTPILVGGLLMIFPPVGFIGLIFGLYGLYLLYLGFPLMMKTPEDKIVPYFGFSIASLAVISIALGFIYRIILWDVIIGALKNILINAHPLK